MHHKHMDVCVQNNSQFFIHYCVILRLFAACFLQSLKYFNSTQSTNGEMNIATFYLPDKLFNAYN